MGRSKGCCCQRGIAFVPGVELTCDVELPWDEGILRRMPVIVHRLHGIFCLFSIRTDCRRSEEIEEWLAPFHEDEFLECLMIDKVNTFGMAIDAEDVMSRAKGSVGRPHLALAMMDAGYVESMDEAFENGLEMEGHAMLNVQTIACRSNSIVHAAGGITSLAHPRYYGVEYEALIQHLKDSNVDAIEAFHRSHSDEERHRLWMLAEQ